MKTLTRLASACLFAFILIASSSYAGDVFTYNAQNVSLTHVNSGLVFPFRAGGFEAGEGIRQYDSSGNDVSVPYNLTSGSHFIAVTVYVYAISPSPGQASIDETVKQHFESIKAEILETYRAALKSEGDFTLKGAKGWKAVFEYDLMGATGSELYLFARKGWFVKFRISYPAGSAEFARPRIAEFLKELDLWK